MQRPKSFVRQFFGILGWMSLGAATIALIFALIGAYGQRTATRLKLEGADTQASVVEKRRHTDSDGDSIYTIVYAFRVGQETFETDQDVSSDLYRRLDEGDTIPVRYWTGDPAVSEIEPGAAAVMGLIGMIGAALGATIALVLGLLAWKRASHATWMARNGVPRQVTIIAHQETSTRINDVLQWRATWREADGREGATRMDRRDDLPEVGSQITILVDPERRRDSVWDRDVLV